MKKILTMLSSVLLVAAPVTSVISCHTLFDFNDDPDSEEEKLFDQIEENAALNRLKNGFDSEFLTTNDTVSDAESLIQDELLEEGVVISKFNIINKKPYENLNEGNNDFIVDTILDGKVFKLKTKVKDVKAGVITREDSELKIEKLIESAAEIPIYSSDDNTAVAKSLESRISSLGGKDAKVSIIKTAKNRAYSKFSDSPIQSINEVTSWLYSLHVEFVNWSEKVLFDKPLTYKGIDTFKIRNAPEAQKEGIAYDEIKKLFNNPEFDVYKRLSTANTIEETSNIIKKIADTYTSILPGLAITEDSINIKQNLKVNDNTILLGFKYKNNPKRAITIIINGITDTQNDPELSAKVIKEKFNKGLSLPNLYEWNTIFDALNFFQAEATKINKNAHIKLADSNFSNAVQRGVDEVAKKIFKLIKKNFSTKFLLSLMANSKQNTHDFLKRTKQKDLIPVIKELKKHSEFQLATKTKKINLELDFENTLENEPKNKSILIAGNVLNINPINIENFKKLLSDVTVFINQPIKDQKLLRSIILKIISKWLLLPTLTPTIKSYIFDEYYYSWRNSLIRFLTPYTDSNGFTKNGKSKIKFSFLYANYIYVHNRSLKNKSVVDKSIGGIEESEKGINLGSLSLSESLKHLIIPEYIIKSPFMIFMKLFDSDDYKKEDDRISLEWTIDVEEKK